MRKLKATSRDRREKPGIEPRAARTDEKKKGSEMVRAGHVTMKRIAGDVTQSVGSGYEPKWTTAFWFGRGDRAGLAETRPAGNSYEGHLLRQVSGLATRSETLCGSLPEVKAALLAAAQGLGVVQDKPPARR